MTDNNGAGINLSICSFASGSSGNSYMIRSEGCVLLVDAGISRRRIKQSLAAAGADPRSVKALLLTHEHSDHIKSAAMLARDGIRVYGSGKTLCGSFESVPEDACELRSGDRFEIGGISVSCFGLSHDAAEPLGYSFSRDGSSIVIITDTGVVTEEMLSFMEDAGIIVLESNHDESMLRIGRYPWFLKQRILGERGHLSNEAAALALAEVLTRDRNAGRRRQRTVLLAHLSKENNFPELAEQTVKNVLSDSGFRAGSGVWLETLPRDEMSPVYILEKGGK